MTLAELTYLASSHSDAVVQNLSVPELKSLLANGKIVIREFWSSRIYTITLEDGEIGVSYK